MTRDNFRSRTTRDDIDSNPNSLHDFHSAKRGPRGIPKIIMTTDADSSIPKNPGHRYANTEHITFDFFDQRRSNAPFGYEHFVSLPPGYSTDSGQSWPLILFLHGAGESQREENESYLTLRHGIPKIILCYDRVKSRIGNSDPSISIPQAERLRKTKQDKQGDNSEVPVPAEVCELLAENFITVTPSLNMTYGYGWNASILSALLDEIVDRYRVDLDRVHVTGFSMGGYGTWSLAMHTPNRFASLVPICGGGDHLRVSHIKHIPQRIYHGELDDIIPVKASQQMVDALHELGATDVNITKYPNLMHDSWTEAYNSPEIYGWMLATRRTVRGEEQAVPENNKVIVSVE